MNKEIVSSSQIINSNDLITSKKHKKKHNNIPTPSPTSILITNHPSIHRPTVVETMNPTIHHGTMNPTTHHTKSEKAVYLKDDPVDPVPPMPLNETYFLKDEPEPVPPIPLNETYFLKDEPEPVPPMPLNSTYFVKDEPEPVPPMPLNATYFVKDEPEPVPLIPNNTISMSMNELTTTTTHVSNESNFGALPFILLTSLAAIGFITYKRYKKRFIYQRIPDNDDSLDL